MAAFSHISNLSESSLAGSLSNVPFTADSHHPVSWIVYDHRLPESAIEPPADVQDVVVNDTSIPSQKLRILGRGGYGSRPRRCRTFSMVTGSSVQTKDIQRSVSDIKLANQTQTETVPALRIAGRGGAGSKPRAFETKRRLGWFKKSKSKSVSASTSTAKDSDSEDDGLVIFAPIPQPSRSLKSSEMTSPTTTCPSLCSDNYLRTPSMTLASTSSEFCSSLSMPKIKRSSKLEKILGQDFTQDTAFMLIKPPRLEFLERDDSRRHSQISISSFRHTPPSIRRPSDGLQATDSSLSSVDEAFVDDRYEASIDSPVSPITFFEPPVASPAKTPDESAGDQYPTFFVSYHYPAGSSPNLTEIQ